VRSFVPRGGAREQARLHTRAVVCLNIAVSCTRVCARGPASLEHLFIYILFLSSFLCFLFFLSFF
jgi:hypothetical protein